MKLIPAVVLSGLLATGTVSAAQAAPHVDLRGGFPNLELVLQAGEVVAGFNVLIGFDPTNVNPTLDCVNFLEGAEVFCDIQNNTLRVLVAAPYEFPIPFLKANAHIADITFESVNNKAGQFWIIEENYFDNNIFEIAPKKGKKKWRFKVPRR